MEGSKEEEEDACLEFTAKSFYGNGGRRETDPRGARLQEILANVERGAEYIDRHPLPSTYRPGILGPPAVWKVFRRQVEAIRYAEAAGNGLMVFAFEGDGVGSGGKRNFLVTHPDQMWLRQSERLPEKRCVYEVIREESPCKLYFDLEFLRASNPDRNGTAMTNAFIRIVCHFLRQEFSISPSRKDIIDLRGTSASKFSRHLIFNIPGTAFATNGHAGAFVRMVCGRLREWKDGTETIQVPNVSLRDVEELFVLDSKGSEVLFCDEGVYSKNRNFRLYLSTKMGQNSPLVIAEENEYTPNERSGNSREKQVFLDSLTTLVDDNCRILRYQDKEEEERVAKQGGSVSSGTVSTDIIGSNRSPYPEIDYFIGGLVVPGSIHSFRYFPRTESLVYNIVRHRYCHNINREHKSNNVMYVVNLKEATYYQKCHDPDCRNFRSETWPLPKEIVFWRDLGEEEDMREWMDCAEESDSGGGNVREISSGCPSEVMVMPVEEGGGRNVSEGNVSRSQKEDTTVSPNKDVGSANVNASSNKSQSEEVIMMSRDNYGSGNVNKSRNEGEMVVSEDDNGSRGVNELNHGISQLEEENMLSKDDYGSSNVNESNNGNQSQEEEMVYNKDNHGSRGINDLNYGSGDVNEYSNQNQLQEEEVMSRDDHGSRNAIESGSNASQSQQEEMRCKDDRRNTNVIEYSNQNQSQEEQIMFKDDHGSRNVNQSSVTQLDELDITCTVDNATGNMNEPTVTHSEGEVTASEHSRCNGNHDGSNTTTIHKQTETYSDPMYKWEHIQDLITSQSTSGGSSGSQCLWDGLSQISSPNTSSLEALSQPSQSTGEETRDQDIANSCSLSDEELLKAVTYTEELLLRGDREMDLTC